jgi:hypothetical protein
MHFVLDLLQGLGIAAAIGIRPVLPTLLTGLLAAGDVGLDFDGTSFAFLESYVFLAVAAVVLVALELYSRRRGVAPDAGPVGRLLLGVSVALGALMAAGSLDDRGNPWVVGLILGGAAAALGWFAAHSLFTRVRRRLDREAAAALPVYGEGAAVVSAGGSILFPPLAVLVLGALGWLLAGGRRREGEKYAGLRILR